LINFRKEKNFRIFISPMKHLSTLFLLALSTALWSQGLPKADIQNLQGQSFDAATLQNNDGPMIVSFWATWCKPCISELNAFHDYYLDLEETGVRVLAISIDDARTMNKVAPFAAGQGWSYDVYLDPNSNLRRAMGVNNVPHTFLLDAKGTIVWQANKYVPDEEEELAHKVERLAAGETLD
jgi:cytochrome c biogenesis protein CcmG, thiol:disulfide interchange protein DsbE